MLQPFDPNSPDKNKHKFMVQTMFAPPDFTQDQLDVVVSQENETVVLFQVMRIFQMSRFIVESSFQVKIDGF